MSHEFFHLQQPLWLLLLLALPAVAYWHHHRRAMGALTYSSLAGLGRTGSWRLHFAFYCRLLAAALMILALARPQMGRTSEESLTEGIDIEIVLDISGSMAAEDFQPRNRLEVAKDVLREFIARRPGDRIGLVVFAGQALTKAPLTTDHEMLLKLVDSVELFTLPDGTAIGQALAAGAARIKNSQAKTKILVLLTDGVNNRGVIDPDSAAGVCEGLGIKVYTVGVGTEGVVPVPTKVLDPFGNERIQRMSMEVDIDEELLQRIAERTQGEFFQATDPQGLRRVFDRIDQLEKTPLQVKRYVLYQERFQPWVWAALGLLLLPLVPALLRATAEP